MGVASVCELHSSVELSPEPSLRPSAAPLAVPLCAEQTESRSIMGVEGCTKCIKYLLFFFNFIFWVSALACVSPSCWTSSRPPPIYREACSGTRARTLSAAGARGGEITVSAGVVGESCARSAYVTTLYLRGKVWVLCADVHRWGQIRCVTAGDVHCSVCVAGKVGAGSLVCLVCGFVWITSSRMRACVRVWVGWVGGGVSTG